MSARPSRTACPACGGSAYAAVLALQSRAVGRRYHRICNQCGTAYLPARGQSHTAALIEFLLGIALLVGVAYLATDGGQRPAFSGATERSNTLMVFMGAIGGVLVCAGILGARTKEPTKTVVILKDDGGSLSPDLAAFLAREPSPSPSQPPDSLGRTTAGWCLTLLGGTLICASMSMLFLGIKGSRGLNTRGGEPPPEARGISEIDIPLELRAASFVLGLALNAPGLWLFQRGRRLRTPGARRVLQRDQRRPVLLLRSFGDDHLAEDLTFDFRSGGMIQGTWMPNMFGGANTFEDTIATTYSSVGPVMAVGRPGEKLPPTGASRVWISDEDWQARVLDFLSWSAHIVMVLGDAEKHAGLRWEVEKVFSVVSPEKLCVVVPPHLDEDELRSRWQNYIEISQGKMPEYQPRAIAVRFKPDWTPILSFDTSLPERRDRCGGNHWALVAALTEARDWVGLA